MVTFKVSIISGYLKVVLLVVFLRLVAITSGYLKVGIISGYL